MFTGIVEEQGAVVAAVGGRLVVRCRTAREGSEVGASVAVNGVCLTVVERPEGALAFDLSPETLARTSLGRLRPGQPVNLERPVTLLTRLGGHLVQGHVDGVGEVVAVEPDGRGGAVLTVRAPGGLARYLVEKGSVAVDGVSLTVAGIDGDAFRVALIPHTRRATTLGAVRPGDPVNIEVDVIAKHVERLLAGAVPAAGAGGGRGG
ncbi:MAG TPA: riboflavin synthase [Actinomycetota bacterium]|nr:riboflavin synthase [Actinomycetota bacterium]